MKYNQLTAADRGAIQVLLHKNYTLTQIAREIGFNKSTVIREINQRSTSTGYSALVAQANYERRRKKSRKKQKLNDSSLQKYVTQKLQLGWSPEQIVGRLRLNNDNKTVIYHETIYHWLYTDKWAYKQEKLYQYLRYGRR